MGELTSLLISESIDFETALNLVRDRTQIYEEHCIPGIGSMAVTNQSGKILKELLEDFSKTGRKSDKILSIGAFNSPISSSLTGHKTEMEDFISFVSELDTRSEQIEIRVLPISVAAHSLLMAGAVPEYEKLLEKIDFQKPKIDILSDSIPNLIIKNSDDI